MNPALVGLGVVFGVAGAAITAAELGKGLAMEMQHWIMLLVILVGGYVLGRLWAAPAQMVGLP
jgi:hypothetical protein